MSTNVLRNRANLNKIKRHHPPVVDWFHDVDENLVSAVFFHAAIAGAYYALCSNRANTGLKLTLALGDEKVEEWANDAASMTDLLADYNAMLVELCTDKGLLPAPSNAR